MAVIQLKPQVYQHLPIHINVNPVVVQPQPQGTRVVNTLPGSPLAQTNVGGNPFTRLMNLFRPG